jgi:CubicO group peptidase (beta-lactamase class C family)
MKPRIVLLCMVILTQLVSCDALFLGEDENIISYAENIKPPPLLSDGLEVSTLEAEDIDSKLIHDAVQLFTENTDASIHSLLIIRNGKLVLESYFNGWNRKRRHDLRSATKSITSCLVGIAIDKGFIPSIDEPVFDFFPEYIPFANSDPRKESATIRHFLQMRTGLACNDWTSPTLST